MNKEKIKELYGQAWDYANKTHPGYSAGKDFITTSNSIKELQVEKFAELIVGECIGILEPKSRYMGEGPEVLKDKIRQINRHFGVEE